MNKIEMLRRAVLDTELEGFKPALIKIHSLDMLAIMMRAGHIRGAYVAKERYKPSFAGIPVKVELSEKGDFSIESEEVGFFRYLWNRLSLTK